MTERRRCPPFLAAAWLVAWLPAILPTLAPVSAGGAEFPAYGRPRLEADRRGGGLFGGYQTASDEQGEFELFQVRPGGGPESLGRFSGFLAGVAVSPDGRLALTRDGALIRLGDELSSLALPDSRWNLLDLAWLSDGPAALHYKDGELWLVRPEPPDAWRLEGDSPLVRDSGLAKAVVAEFGGSAHVVWNGGANDLSRGALRHLIRRASGWEELEPLPLGDVGDFALFGGDVPELAALVPHPLELEPARLATRRWLASGWSEGRALPESVTRALSESFGLAAALPAGVGEPSWLAAGPRGITLDGLALLRPSGAGGFPWSSLAAASMFGLFFALLTQHCLRSRRLSLEFPGRPAELSSRAAALFIDWLLVSLATTAFHFRAGNVRIYADLLNLGDLHLIFWYSLAAQIVYAVVCEGMWGATIGKFLAGLRVRSARGGPASAGQALLRNLLRFADMFPAVFPGMIGLATALLNPRRQRIGDILAGTVVRRHAPAEGRKFVLASASPRRRELMEALGVDLRVEPAGIDESLARGGTAEETVRLLSQAKARAAADRLEESALVVAADTMVELDGEILGKPTDRAEAADMLFRLSGRSHQVVTGIALFDTATGQGLSDVERTEVEMRRLTRREIDEYVNTGDPLDKAGAYGVQSGFLVKQVRGSLSNVMGLPMELLQALLSQLDS